MNNSILIVEDDQHTYQLVANVLRKSGYQLHYARDAYAALEQIREEPPHLIILDMRLPGLDGWEFTSQLKSHPQTSGIPIIAVTVQVDPDDIERAYAAGVDQYMPKPFNIKLLRSMIEQYF